MEALFQTKDHKPKIANLLFLEEKNDCFNYVNCRRVALLRAWRCSCRCHDPFFWAVWNIFPTTWVTRTERSHTTYKAKARIALPEAKKGIKERLDITQGDILTTDFFQRLHFFLRMLTQESFHGLFPLLTWLSGQVPTLQWPSHHVK